MAIALECPGCGKRLRMNDSQAGRRVKCPHCQTLFEAPHEHPGAAVAPLERSAPRFGGPITLPAVGLVRRLGAVIVAAILLLMPLFYLVVIGVVVAAICWLPLSGSTVGLSPLVSWVLVGVLAVVLVCLVKPLVEPQRKAAGGLPLDLSREPELTEVLKQTCQQFGGQPPSAVSVDCSTQVAMHSRRGQLTIGLPLIACLSGQQLVGLVARELAVYRPGAGSRATNLMRRINHWLWQSVYGKSRFEQWLVIVGERPHFHLAKLLLPLAGAKYVARAVLFVPMFIANTIAAQVVKRADLDADLIAARLIGSQAFGGLVERQELIDFCWEGVLAELDYLHRDQSLPDSLPDQLALRMQDMTPELHAALAETVTKPEERPFDSQLTRPERISAILAGGPAGGVVSAPGPARALFHAYSELSRKLTWDFYVERFGAQHLRMAMKPVATHLPVR